MSLTGRLDAAEAARPVPVDISIAPLPHADTGVFLSTQPVVRPLPTE